MAFKAEIDDDDEVSILANLSEVIEDIFEEMKNDFDIDQFFDLCEAEEPSLELSFVRKAYDSLDLTGNFISKYIDLIVDSYFIIEIQSKVRNKILKKYPHRTKNDDANDSSVDDVLNEPDVTDESVQVEE